VRARREHSGDEGRGDLPCDAGAARSRTRTSAWSP
jgi:hypothetical protein